MDRGLADQPSALAPVPAYPRRAVEQYLADARAAWDELRQSLVAAQARRDTAVAALASADDSHRLLGSMMVEAQRDLAARRAHAEAAAASILAGADEEAERIVRSARRLATGLIDDAPAASAGRRLAAEDDDDDDEDGDDVSWPAPREIGTVPLDPAAAEALRGSGTGVPSDAVAASGTDEGAIELWPSRRPVTAALDGLGWRSRRRERQDQRISAPTGDESYFSRLRDEYSADGSLNTWFEPA